MTLKVDSYTALRYQSEQISTKARIEPTAIRTELECDRRRLKDAIWSMLKG